MTLIFFPPSNVVHADKERYYISQFDGDTYQIVDSVENREFCVCANYDNWKDAKKRAEKIVALLEDDLKRRDSNVEK